MASVKLKLTQSLSISMVAMDIAILDMAVHTGDKPYNLNWLTMDNRLFSAFSDFYPSYKTVTAECLVSSATVNVTFFVHFA